MHSKWRSKLEHTYRPHGILAKAILAADPKNKSQTGL
jgi:hypothetical protein